MNMNKDFFKALEALGEENSVETELLIDKVKSAMLKAARRAYPHSEERISVEIDPKTKKFEMYIRQDIIDDEPIDENEVNIDVAKTMDPNAVRRRNYPEGDRYLQAGQNGCPLRKAVHQGRPERDQP